MSAPSSDREELGANAEPQAAIHIVVLMKPVCS